MKAIKLLVFGIIAVSLAGCKGELFDIKFGMPPIVYEDTLKANPVSGVIAKEKVYNLKLDSVLKARGTNTDKLKSVKATSILVEILSPATANFDVLDSAVFFLSSGKIGDPDFDLLKIAAINGIPDGATSFTIIPEDVDLMRFVKKTTFTIKYRLVTSGPVIENVKLKFTINMDVVANPIP